MIDPSHAAASWFLWIGGTAFLVAYAVPLLLWPMRWARWFLWELPERTELAIYLGRCLGALALVLVGACFRAASRPAQHPMVFEIIVGASALLTLVHLWGAIRKTQPWTETVEVLLYAAVTAGAYWVYLRLPG